MEVEIKLNVQPDVPDGPLSLFVKLMTLHSLGGYPLGSLSTHEILDLYYDTREGALAGAGVGLRVRLLDGHPVITLKRSRRQDGALTAREEFEEPLTQEQVDQVLVHIQDLAGSGPFPVRDFRRGAPCGGLLPVLKVATLRLVRPVGEVAELALDVVRYPDLVPNPDFEPYFDVEVEAKGLSVERLLETIQKELMALGEGYLIPAPENKLRRGLRLKENAPA